MKARGIFRGGAVVGLGVAASQVINILSYPVLSRLFSPADFGTFSLFFFGMQVLGASLAGRYEQAVMMCRTHVRARHALMLAQVTAVIATLVLVAIFGLLHRNLDAWTGSQLGAYWMVVPIAGFFVAAQTSLTFMAVRLGRYGAVSVARILKSAAAFTIQIALVYSIWGGVGALIAGETIGAALSIIPVLSAGRRNKDRNILRSRRGRRYIARLAGLYIDQPLWNLPHVFLSQLSRWAMAMMITGIYSPTEAGAYFMMFRVVMMPSTLVSRSLSQVFFRAAAEEQRRTGSFRHALKSVTAVLIGLGFVATAVLMLYGPDLFVLVLGNQWVEAGKMAAIFAPYVILQMVLATVAPSYLLGGRQKSMLAVACLQTTIFLVGFLIGHALGKNIYWAIGMSVWLSVPYMAAMLYWYWRMSVTPASMTKEGLKHE
jgi:O-antigen/teichoic acid export membrane protein